jgi:hypothetical protein
VSNGEFTKKELDEIRDMAIRMYVTDNNYGLTQDTLRIRVIAEATYRLLKQKGKIKDEKP